MMGYRVIPNSATTLHARRMGSQWEPILRGTGFDCCGGIEKKHPKSHKSFGHVGKLIV
jgi:hypothetical protein